MERVTVMIAMPLEAELAAQVAAVDERLEVLYEPELLPPARFTSDHRGADGFRRDPEGQRRWDELLGRAEVLLGLPGDSAEGLSDAVRRGARLRWVQGTAAGAGEQVRGARLTPEELERVAVTTSSGIHGALLAEWSLFGLLAFVKGLPRLLADKQARRWDHYTVGELRGRTLLVVGLGSIGLEVARLAQAFGMRTIGVKRRVDADAPHVEELHPPERLKELAPRADAIVVTLPLTEETEGLVDREAIELMKPGATFVNVGRGGVVDEDALVEALREGRLAGAALDVFRREPLPAESPLWELPNVILSPHAAALSELENARIVELFCDNLRRYLRGEELRNRVDPHLFY